MQHTPAHCWASCYSRCAADTVFLTSRRRQCPTGAVTADVCNAAGQADAVVHIRLLRESVPLLQPWCCESKSEELVTAGGSCSPRSAIMAGTTSESRTTMRCAAPRHSRAVSMFVRAAAARRSAERLELSMRARPCRWEESEMGHMQSGRRTSGTVSR